MGYCFFFQMEKFKLIKDNHELCFSIDLIPYKYISATIRDFLKDLKELEATVSKEPEILILCETLKSEINGKIDYLRNKLENIQNPKYLNESDEEFVDKLKKRTNNSSQQSNKKLKLLLKPARQKRPKVKKFPRIR